MPTYIMAVEAVGRDELKLAMGTPPEGLITQLAMPRLTPDGQLPIPKDRRGVQVAIAVGLGLAAAGDVALDRHAPGSAAVAATRPPRWNGRAVAAPAPIVGAPPRRAARRASDGGDGGGREARWPRSRRTRRLSPAEAKDVRPLGTHPTHRSGARAEADGQAPTKALTVRRDSREGIIDTVESREPSW